MYNNKKFRSGFTLIELLVVVAIIGLLSTVVLASLSGARDKGKKSKAQAEIAQVVKAVEAARINTGDVTLMQVTGSSCSYCYGAAGMAASMQTIATKSGFAGIERIVTDPWGNPYSLDENETEGGSNYCILDRFASTKVTYYFPSATAPCAGTPGSGWVIAP